jgi:hypothetical protein
MDLTNGYKVIYEAKSENDNTRSFYAAASNEYPTEEDRPLVTFTKGALKGKTVYEHKGVLYAVENYGKRFDEEGNPVGTAIFDFNTAFSTEVQETENTNTTSNDVPEANTETPSDEEGPVGNDAE